MGVLTVGGRAGSEAADVKKAGSVIEISLVPADPITQCTLKVARRSVADGVRRSLSWAWTREGCLGKAAPRTQRLRLASVPLSWPKRSMAADTPMSHLVGGGELSMLRTAKLPTLKRGSDPAACDMSIGMSRGELQVHPSTVYLHPHVSVPKVHSQCPLPMSIRNVHSTLSTIPSCPVPSRPVPSCPVPSRPVPSRPVQSRPVPSRPSSYPRPNVHSYPRPLPYPVPSRPVPSPPARSHHCATAGHVFHSTTSFGRGAVANTRGERGAGRSLAAHTLV